MERSKLISVIVPIYNVEDYLRECVDSILAQSYRELEIILVDDGSTDSSGDICDQYAHQDDRITVIHKKNGGPSDARNVGIEASHGEYLSFVDSDDYIDKFFIETLYQACEEKECKIAVYALRREKTNIRTRDKECQVSIININSILTDYYGKWHNTIIVVWNKLYHREVIGETRYPKGFVYEDEALTYEVLYRAERVAWISSDRVLYHYRNRIGSITKSGFSLRQLDVLEAYRRRRSFYIEHKETELARREEYCYLSELLKFYYLLGKYLPEETERRENLLLEYKEKHRSYDKSTWSWSRRIFYQVCRVFPVLYGLVKKLG